jgi:phosphoglycolate phosphatase
MAQNAGVDAVAVGYGAHPIESLSTWNPRTSVRSVVELQQWLMTNA